MGPIPARAGEPHANTIKVRSSRAYPRSRGGTERHGAWRRRHLGLSPLARGNQDREGESIAAFGPIPARAGEPERGRRVLTAAGAYPRSRGGTWL